MRVSGFGPYALSIYAAALMLAGCGGPQPPIGAPGAMPQRAITREQAKRHPSMSPDTNGTYLYVANNELGVIVYKRFPRMDKRTATIIRDLRPVGVCSDKDGNVFVTGYTSESEILEYAHGGTTPIATLADSPSNATIAGCAVDQDTENLAVANEFTLGFSSSGNVLVYDGAQGTPTVYTDSVMTKPVWCAYDNSRNLYVAGVTATGNVVYAILRKGSTGLVNLNISGLQPYVFGGIAWDGKYLAVFGSVASGSDSVQIYQIQISGTSGTVVNKITLDGFRIGGGMTIYDGQLLLPIDYDQIARWRYPAGGNPKDPHQQLIYNGVTDEAISAKPKS